MKTTRVSIQYGAVKDPQETTRNRQMPDFRWSSWLIGCAAVNRSTAAVTVLIVVCSLVLDGCSRSRRVQTVAYGSVGWEPVDEADSRAGIDHAILEWYRRGENVEYLIWTDLHGGSGSGSSSSGTSSSGTENHKVELRSSDGGRFECQYAAQLDDSSEKRDMTIDGVTYKLGDGSLILVSTRGDRAQVKQLNLPDSVIDVLRDKSQTQSSLRDTFRAMATDNADIRNFFENVARQE